MKKCLQNKKMQAKKRYILVILSCAFLAYCYFGGYRLKNLLLVTSHQQSELSTPSDPVELSSKIPAANTRHRRYALPSFTTSHERYETYQEPLRIPEKAFFQGRQCRMETCFDLTRCSHGKFLVYVYPLEPLNSLGAAPPISSNYQKILTAIQESRYHTKNPHEACLFVLGIDTLDRDSLSEDYVRNVPSRLARLPHWNNGRNHLIFNLYSGTWPDYVENSLGFDTGEAILAKASMSIQQFRRGFDVSIPLFHKQFPLRSGNTGFVQTNNFPANKKYLLAFKGKR